MFGADIVFELQWVSVWLPVIHCVLFQFENHWFVYRDRCRVDWYWPRHLIVAYIASVWIAWHRQVSRMHWQQSARMHLAQVRMEFNTVFCRHTFERRPYMEMTMEFSSNIHPYMQRLPVHCSVLHPGAATTRNINLFIVYKTKSYFFLLFAFRLNIDVPIRSNIWRERKNIEYWNDVVCSPNNNKNHK